MINATLCYIEKDGKYLMLHRIKKRLDINEGKWIGVGGKLEDKESPEECLLREVREETGLALISYRYRGIVTFVSDRYPTEYMHLFTADEFSGELSDCAEGELAWVDKRDVPKLNLWEGDRIFLDLLDSGAPFFSLKLQYEGNKLVSAILNGKPIKAAP